ncbi:MAG: serine protease [Phycisphaeraceae bacterium]
MHGPRIDELSTTSLCLEVLEHGRIIGYATGFVVKHRGAPFLITNWHVVSATNPLTNEEKAMPTAMRVWHHRSKLGNWTSVDEPLLDENKEPLWIEHPTGKAVDVVALPLTIFAGSDVRFHPLSLDMAEFDLAIACGEPVQVIGFPQSFTGRGRLPIWKTGHIASEPEIDYDDQPVFLIDATTRGGMSGSPVVARRLNGYATRGGGTVIGNGGTRFLGVYAGREGETSEIGRVWKSCVIQDVLENHTYAGRAREQLQPSALVPETITGAPYESAIGESIVTAPDGPLNTDDRANPPAAS